MFEQNSLSLPDTLNVITWNILLDKTRTKNGLILPQSERIESQIKTLRELGIDLDVVGIQEAEKTPEQHNGELIARALGYKAGLWFQYNQPQPGTKKGRKGEYVGLFGNLVQNAEPIELGDNRMAVVTRIGDIAVATTHLRHEFWGPLRLEQMKVLMDNLRGEPHAVVMGDFNALPVEGARRELGKNGFVSAFQPHLPTYPAPSYRDIMLTSFQQKLSRGGVSIDGIYVRGMHVEDGDRFAGDSDHYGLWAKVRKAS